ncbi:hypothetical protein ACW2Q0_30860 [Nocardia sp. R16R-3T]
MTTPRPHDPDVHLRVVLDGVGLDFAACRTAAMQFIKEWRRARPADYIAVIPGSATGLVRLPGERLFLE